ncbi:MAG: S8 family serine peptidase, partial [Gammaproteobacteria bacterium]
MAAAALLATLATHSVLAQAAGEAGPTARLIIKFRTTAGAATGQRQIQVANSTTARSQPERVRSLADRTGLELGSTRDLGSGMVGLALRTELAGDSLDATLATLRADPEVEFAEVDQRRYARALPSDPLYASQWYLQGVEISATNFIAAWDTTTGATDTVIAILDTGIRFEHPDLAGRVLAGYDFVSGESSMSFVAANDGDDWDSDPSDPGDWVSDAENMSGPLAGCDVGVSSWHGTRVAAMIGADTDNGTGIAAGTWLGSILPVRVLGKCGGYDSDIVSGMRWAAGLTVAGVPANPHPAQILNMSLGSPGSCASVYRNVFTELTAARVLVVISAGNEHSPVDSPANCSGALAVGGLRHAGTKSGFGNVPFARDEYTAT